MPVRTLSLRPAVVAHPVSMPSSSGVHKPTPRPSPDTFLPGLSVGTLKAKLRRAEDLMAFRLGGLRATVFTAPPQNLSEAARASGVPELERAGRALAKTNEQFGAAMLRRVRLEQQVAQHPGDTKLARELETARNRELVLTRELRSDSRDVQRLMSNVDVDTLARIEKPLTSIAVPEANTLSHVLAEVRALRDALDPRNV